MAFNPVGHNKPPHRLSRIPYKSPGSRRETPPQGFFLRMIMEDENPEIKRKRLTQRD
jgi:hypothetical protein